MVSMFQFLSQKHHCSSLQFGYRKLVKWLFDKFDLSSQYQVAHQGPSNIKSIRKEQECRAIIWTAVELLLSKYVGQFGEGTEHNQSSLGCIEYSILLFTGPNYYFIMPYICIVVCIQCKKGRDLLTLAYPFKGGVNLSPSSPNLVYLKVP